MFKNKKNNNKYNSNIYDKNHIMKDSYDTSNLVVANLQYISSGVTDFGPMCITTSQKYIFEETVINGKINYREIFTGFVADTQSSFFDLPYVVNIKPIKEEIKDISDVVPKLGMLLVLDSINSNMEKETVKKIN